MDNILRKIKKLIPRKIFSFLQPIYHYKLALLGALIALKSSVWGHRYPRYFVLSRVTSLLLLVVCISLLLSGAGALAFDLPL